VICVGVWLSLPKRRRRVVIYYVGDLLHHRGKAAASMLVVSWIMTRVRIWEKHCVVCGFSWLFRVVDHDAVLMDPKLFLELGSQVSGVVETCASRSKSDHLIKSKIFRFRFGP
jgi:hypothetical protein